MYSSLGEENPSRHLPWHPIESYLTNCGGPLADEALDYFPRLHLPSRMPPMQSAQPHPSASFLFANQETLTSIRTPPFSAHNLEWDPFPKDAQLCYPPSPQCGLSNQNKTATAGSDVVQSGRPIFDDFFQPLWPYIGNNTANVVFQMVKRLWLIRIDQ
ncbi:hypothetical protein TNCV_1264431 [Trichonephila clavipes]|nr:hypothetical protein TNCV_1264431 [Trichonephila clavipes]